MADILAPMTQIMRHSTVLTLGSYTVGGYRCGAMVAMVIVGNHAYCLKTHGKNDDEEDRKFPIVFYEIKNFRSTNPIVKHWTVKTASGSTSIALHANSLTYVNGMFYIATMNNVSGDYSGSQVVGFSIAGAENSSEVRLTEKYTYTHKVTSLNYYNTVNNVPYYLACVGDNDEYGYYRFHMVHPSGNTLVYDNVNFITGHSLTYSYGNDSFYDVNSKMLYTTRFNRTSSETVLVNGIYKYDLTAGVSGTSGIYEPVHIMEVSANSNEAKYEIEGIAIHTSSGNIYACANVNNQSGVEGVDTISYLY